MASRKNPKHEAPTATMIFLFMCTAILILMVNFIVFGMGGAIIGGVAMVLIVSHNSDKILQP